MRERGKTERTEASALSLRRARRGFPGGVVHATFVSARMDQALERLIVAGVLDEAQMDEARRANAANVKRFAHGMEAIEAHARLTLLGQAIMSGAQRCMRPYLRKGRGCRKADASLRQ